LDQDTFPDSFGFDSPAGPPAPTRPHQGDGAPEEAALGAADLADLWGDGDGAASADWGGAAAEEPAAITAAPTDPEAAFQSLRKVVNSTWGFDSFRPLQAEAMRATLAGRDALVVLPTGGGKSLCYQAPAIVREGLTVVVSPLIALMKDQCDGLQAVGVRAAMLTSAQDAEERALVSDALRRGELDILLCSPERMAIDGFLKRLVRWGLAAVAIDEAHCISHWGHDFRPEYRKLDRLKREFPDLPVMAFTATAPPNVREDIVAHLGLAEDAAILVGDFDRANLTYRVLPRATVADQIMQVVQRHPGDAGIVYAMRRKDTERIARDLAGRGVRCLPYHAGLDRDERRRAQEAFQGEQVDVIVATVAFGMGIDRPDVRFVIHASLPKGIEQYTQETGRAGRDGLESECVMFFGGADYHGWKGLMERSAQDAAASGVEGVQEELDASLERLDELWGFACGAKCRHQILVEHFGGTWIGSSGDGPDAGCAACDVCLKELELVVDGKVIAQKILSCIVRCDQRRGAAHVADVLRGADTAKVRQNGHEKLSTYGLLADHRVRDIRAWIDQLISQSHIGVASGEYPTLFLTQSGVALMKGEVEVDLYVPAGPAPKKGKSRAKLAAIAEADGADPDPKLFESLRKLRRDLAKERGVPPYILFNDRTLALLATVKPKDEATLLGIKGIGEKKAADLGPLVLAHIAEQAQD
jgi:ATP-dependent DNA helicase RecQ